MPRGCQLRAGDAGGLADENVPVGESALELQGGRRSSGCIGSLEGASCGFILGSVGDRDLPTDCSRFLNLGRVECYKGISINSRF